MNLYKFQRCENMSELTNNELNERVNKDLIQKNIVLENKIKIVSNQLEVISSLLDNERTDYRAIKASIDVLKSII